VSPFAFSPLLIVCYRIAFPARSAPFEVFVGATCTGKDRLELAKRERLRTGNGDDHEKERTTTIEKSGGYLPLLRNGFLATGICFSWLGYNHTRFKYAITSQRLERRRLDFGHQQDDEWRREP